MALPAILTSAKARKYVVFAVCMIPLLILGFFLVFRPPVDPYERIAHMTGEFALRFLILTLLVTPLKQAFNWKWIGAFRRPLGLAAFTYALAHFQAYLILEAQYEFGYFLDDIVERKYIVAGSVAFLLMVPLALTSNNFSVSKLGGKTWKKLHFLVFPLTLAAIAHLYLQTRGDKTVPLVYLGVVLALFAWRIGYKIVTKRRQAK